MILLADVAAGALNAVGGGSFVTLSAVDATGGPPVIANATTTVAVLPGNATSAWVRRREIHSFQQLSTLGQTLASVVGLMMRAFWTATTSLALFVRAFA